MYSMLQAARSQTHLVRARLATPARSRLPLPAVYYSRHRAYAAGAHDELFSVAGSSVVITGGAQGIGRALAEGFAQRGCSVYVLDVKGEDAERCAAELQSDYAACKGALGLSCDVGNQAQVQSAAARVGEECRKDGRQVDVVINCAGVTKRLPAEEFPIEDFDRIQNVNVRGSWMVSTNFATEMMKSGNGGCIINIDSFVTASVLKGVIPYSISKAGIQAMTKGLALEWGERGIRVNGIAPGLIYTPISKALWDQPHMQLWAHEQTPMNRMGDVQDLVGAAIFLASPSAKFISGQTIRVDGGLSAGRHWPIDGPSASTKPGSIGGRRSYSTSSSRHAPTHGTFNYKAGAMVANPFEGDGVEVNQKAGTIAGAEHSVIDGRDDPELVCSSGKGLARRGVSLQKHTTPFHDYRDDAQVKAQYYPELVAEACRLVGADKAIVASHVKRKVNAPEAAAVQEDGVRPGAFMVHGDFNNELKEQLLTMIAQGKPCVVGKGGLDLSEDQLEAGRLIVLNFWKPMSPEPVHRAPFAACDATSMSESDLHTYAHDPQPPPQNYTLPLPNTLTIATTSPEHRWIYFSALTPEEWMVVKTYDSAGPQPGNGVGVHSAFNDPSTVTGSPARESIEARVICFISQDAAPSEKEVEDGAKWEKGNDESISERPQMENVQRLDFYRWLESDDWTGPVGLTAKFTIPNEKVEIYLDIMRENIAGTRAEEGMSYYDLVPDYISGTAGPDVKVYWLLERFKTKHDLLLHVQSKHYKRCQERFLEDMGGHPLVQIGCYRIDPVEPRG